MTVYKDAIGGDHQAATIIVAAHDSLHPEQADYVCDGVADDVQIQAAIDANSESPKRVVLLDGKFVISASIIIKGSIELVGQGKTKTKIELAASSNVSLIKNDVSKTTWFCRIADLTLQMGESAATRDAHTSGHGIEIDTAATNHFSIDNVRIWYCKDSGIYIDYGYQRNISNSTIEHNGDLGIYSGSNVANGTNIINSIIQSNLGAYQCYITTGGTNKIISNYLEGTAGIYMWGFDSVVGFNYLKATAVGLHFASRSNTITGNVFDSAGGFAAIHGHTVTESIVSNNIVHTTVSGTDALLFTGDCSRNTITGNTLHSLDRYALRTEADVIYDNIIDSNYFNGNVIIKANMVNGVLAFNRITGTFSIPSASTFVCYEKHSDLLMDVLAVSTTHVRSNEDLSAGTPITFTIDAQPDIPRTLSWAFDSHAQITEYDMEVIGVDAKGNTVTETWDETAGWSGETSNAFATITSIKMTSRTGTGAGDTMDIGITDVLGLSNVIYAASDVFKIKKNNANATVAGAQVNTTYDTYDMSVITLGAADDFTIWYKSNLNIIS